MANGKRTTAVREGVDRMKLYPLEEAVKMVKDRAKAKFDETIEVAMNLGVDPRHADQMVRGVVTLPKFTFNGNTYAVNLATTEPDGLTSRYTLVVGGNNLSTEVSGVIADYNPCGCFPGIGNLEKAGTGTLILSGINTYTGTTTVNGGVLQVDGSIVSSSFTT